MYYYKTINYKIKFLDKTIWSEMDKDVLVDFQSDKQ